MKITNSVKQWLLITLLIFSSVSLFSKYLWSPPSSSATTKLPMNNEHYPEWNKTLGGTGNQQGYGIVECNNGDFAIVGETEGLGFTDALLMRTDNAGNQLWNQTFGGIMVDVAGTIIECSDGGFAITGVSFDMVKDDTWLLRTDANGNQLWNYTFTSTTRDAFNTVLELPAGGFAVAGSTGSFGAGGKDIWLIFFDASGQPTLNFTYGGAEDDATTKIIKCHNGGYLISGVTQSYGAGMQDMWLLRISDAGDLLWSHTYGGAGWDSLYDIIECYGGGFALAGTANSSGAGSWDMMLIFTDINGNSLWQKTYGGSDRDGTYNVEQLADYGFVLGGWTYSFGAGMEDIWVVRTDSYGNHQWNQTFGGTIYDECFDMTKTADGGYVLVGTTFSFGDPLDIWLLYFQDDSEPFTPPPIPLELIIVLVIIIIVIVILSILLYRRRQSKI